MAVRMATSLLAGKPPVRAGVEQLIVAANRDER